jgi:hypothetical protein
MVTAYIASRIVASALPTIMIVFPFDFIIAYMLVTIAWFVLLDQNPESRTRYLFCKGCMFGSVSPVCTFGAIAFAGTDIRLIFAAPVLLIVGLGIGHILGRILIPAAVERSHFNSIRWRG